jgi:hypothetical protein
MGAGIQIEYATTGGALPPTGVLMYMARSLERGMRGEAELHLDLLRKKKNDQILICEKLGEGE